MYELTLSIPMVPLALNKTLRAGKWKNHKQNLQWDAYISAFVCGKKPPLPLEHAVISLQRYSARTLDYDGLVGSMKPVVDALVTNGILKDDSWKVLGKWDVDQFYRPKKLGPELVIYIRQLTQV